MGRSPDFMNVTFAAWPRRRATSPAAGPSSARTCGGLLRVHQRARPDPDHSLINLQRSRTASGVFNLEEGTALQVVRETDAGIVVRGARILATLGPLSDEIAVYSPRVARHTETHSPFALNFAIPCATPGSSSCAARASTWAGPTSSTRSARASRRWTASSSSTMCWCRGSACVPAGRRRPAQRHGHEHHSMTHTAHQGAAKNRQVRVRPRAGAPDDQDPGQAHLPHSEERLAELMLYTELTKACTRLRGRRRSSTNGASCARRTAGREHPQPLHDRLPQNGGILQLLGSSSFMIIPTEADFSGPLAPEIAQYPRPTPPRRVTG